MNSIFLACLCLLLQFKLATFAPVDEISKSPQETISGNTKEATADETSPGLPNPIEGLQQLFNPTSGQSGRPMAVLGTFQTLFMPMPSLPEGIQQGQAIINGMNTLGSVFKPLVDGAQAIQQTG